MHTCWQIDIEWHTEVPMHLVVDFHSIFLSLGGAQGRDLAGCQPVRWRDWRGLVPGRHADSVRRCPGTLGRPSVSAGYVGWEWWWRVGGGSLFSVLMCVCVILVCVCVSLRVRYIKTGKSFSMARKPSVFGCRVGNKCISPLPLLKRGMNSASYAHFPDPQRQQLEVRSTILNDLSNLTARPARPSLGHIPA